MIRFLTIALVTATIYGNQAYYSDGTYSNTTGNTTWYSDGTYCTHHGNQIFCN